MAGALGRVLCSLPAPASPTRWAALKASCVPLWAGTAATAPFKAQTAGQSTETSCGL